QNSSYSNRLGAKNVAATKACPCDGLKLQAEGSDISAQLASVDPECARLYQTHPYLPYFCAFFRHERGSLLRSLRQISPLCVPYICQKLERADSRELIPLFSCRRYMYNKCFTPQLLSTILGALLDANQ